MQEPFRLDGLVALVTGGASGIGEAICRAFTQAGASVVILDFNLERAQQLETQLSSSRAVQCDVTNEAAVKQAFQGIQQLDILVNCAGIGLVGGVQDTELDDFQRLMRVNVEGVFLTTKHALPLLLESHGSVLNIGSVAGLVGVKKRFAYCATKGAVIAMTRQLSVDYPKQIRANCIAPGTIDTPFVSGYIEKYHQHEKEKVREELNQRQPIGRLGTPGEIASLAVYMSSRQASFMNGSVVTIDGGWTAA